MKTHRYQNWIYWLVALVVLLPITFFGGYRYAMLSHFVGGTLITEKEALQMRGRYGQNAKPVNDVVQGWEINRQQFDDMKAIEEQKPDVSSFRIYEGLTDNFDTVRIMYGVFDNVTFNTLIYLTPNKQSGLCPPFCDIHRGETTGSE